MWTRWPGYLRWYITYNWVIVCYLLPITPKQHLIFNATEIAPIIYVSVSCNIPQNISNKKNRNQNQVALFVALSLPTRNFHEFPETLEGKSHISEFPCYSKTSPTKITSPGKRTTDPPLPNSGIFWLSLAGTWLLLWLHPCDACEDFSQLFSQILFMLIFVTSEMLVQNPCSSITISVSPTSSECSSTLKEQILLNSLKMFFSSCDCFFNFVRHWFFVCILNTYIYIYTHTFFGTVVRVVHGLRTFNLCHVVTQASRRFTYSKPPQVCLKCHRNRNHQVRRGHFWDKNSWFKLKNPRTPNKKKHVNKKHPDVSFVKL